MSETISESTKLHIQEMLLYPQISEKVYSDTIRGKTYKLFEIEDDGTLYLGETSFKWYNSLFRLDKEIPFEVFVLRVFAAICEISAVDGKRIKNIVSNGLSEEIVKKLIASKDVNNTIDRLYDTLRFAIKSSPMASSSTNVQDKPKNVLANINFSGQVPIPVYDSAGNVLVHVVFKPTGYTID